MNSLSVVVALTTPAGAGGGVPGALMIPFGLLLVLIAAMPLSPAGIKRYWDRYYAHVSIGLGLFVVAWYLLKIPEGGTAVLHTVSDYTSFICLIGSLFVVAGGIHVQVRDDATPLANVTFLGLSALLANVIGTTGASMVLIRPWIRMNKLRSRAYHVVFFIFVVSNVGGALTPIGDPPLFLGYLRGIPFFWLLQHVVVQWIFTLCLLLAAFYFFDRRGYRQTPKAVQLEIRQPSEGVKISGKINFLFLGVIVGAVFLPDLHFLREIVMLAAAFASYKFTPGQVHASNEFGFGPIREVAFLFAGIFATMLPALGYIDQHGDEIAVRRPIDFYVASGTLSSVLDNAPTYATFLRLAEASAVSRDPAAYAAVAGDENPTVAVMRERKDDRSLIIATSLGAVFFGAMTYIGNGPNFMVKSIADSSGVKTPSFFGYIFKYSLPILLPILLLSGWVFL